MSDSAPARAFRFDPVPSASKRHDGWTPERQRGFIEALACTGSVKAAARAVGMATEGAYQLRLHDDLGEFRAAWARALDSGVQRLLDAALERAIEGVPNPVFHKGEQVGERRWFDTRLTMFILRYRMPEQFGPMPLPPRAKDRLPEPPPIEQVRANILRKLDAIERHERRKAEAEAAARGDRPAAEG